MLIYKISCHMTCFACPLKAESEWLRVSYLASCNLKSEMKTLKVSSSDESKS